MKFNNKHKRIGYRLSVGLLLLAALAWLLPMQKVSPVFSMPISSSPTADVALNWPDFGQAALGAKDFGLLDTHGSQVKAPTASVAKVFTALAVLKQKPLKPGQEGPIITINQADLDSYDTYFRQGGSLVQVALGEQITQRQALEALMLPSSNNMADTLARWAFGSIENYLIYVNKFNSNIGLKNTVIADTSGFSSDTVSTSEDLVKIGLQVTSNPVLTAIVAEAEAQIPVAGTIRNTNWLLGVDGINGIKTGNTDEAGGCYLFSSIKNINGKDITVIGAAMSAPTLRDAITAGRSLSNSSINGFIDSSVAAGQTVGTYTLPWGVSVPIKVKQKIDLVSWQTKKPTINYTGQERSNLSKGQKIGTLKATAGSDSLSSDLIAGSDSGSAPWRYRLYQRHL